MKLEDWIPEGQIGQTIEPELYPKQGVGHCKIYAKHRNDMEDETNKTKSGSWWVNGS